MSKNEHVNVDFGNLQITPTPSPYPHPQLTHAQTAMRLQCDVAANTTGLRNAHVIDQPALSAALSSKRAASVMQQGVAGDGKRLTGGGPGGGPGGGSPLVRQQSKSLVLPQPLISAAVCM